MTSLRRIAELLSRRVVLRRHLPREFGSQRLFVTPGSALAYWRWNLYAVDPLLLRWAAELVRPGMVVWDIGANNGLFSFAAAFRAGPGALVVAVEADPLLAALLRRSSRGPSCDRCDVVVLNAAVAARAGVVEFSISARGRATSHLSDVEGSSQSGGDRERLHLPSVTLDMLLERFGAPDLVKVDIEGAEEECLRGATKLLTAVQPEILCEVGSAVCSDVTSLLSSHSYVLFDATLPSAEREPLEKAVWNTLAIAARKNRRSAEGSLEL
jgi:FkbM family methyltransferase